jgi:PAS domain S-box-containing protein
VGTTGDSSTVLEQLREASSEIQRAQTIPGVMETVERYLSDILGPTGLEVRLGEPATNEFWQVSEDTTPVDPRQAVDATLSPYATVLSEQDANVLDAEERDHLATAVENSLDSPSNRIERASDNTQPRLVFTDVAMTPIGERGTITIGRVGTAISDADLDTLELLAEYARTAIEELRTQSTVSEQQTELERYETLVESIPDPVYSTDEKGRITVANRAFEREFDYDPEQHHEAHISEYTTTESAAKIREEIRKLVADDENSYTDVSITGIPSGGREREYSASVGVVTHDGEFDGAVGVLRDMTDRHRQEEISKVLNRALRHNLRTTTNNIKGYAEVTQEQVEGDLEGYMDIIRGECDWLMKLADTLRSVRKSVQRGMGSEDIIPVSEMVDPVLRQYEESYPDAYLQAHYNTDGRIEGGTTLRSALSQIVENAIVHNDSNRSSVELWVANAPDDGWIDVHVEDDGPGIPQNEIELIMGETEITQLQHGSGIGLWVSRWLVETFDGELLVESGSDGSVVTLRLRKLPT